MIIHGHVENGHVIPDSGVSLPDGAEVTIVVREAADSQRETMSKDERARYQAALARIDAMANENALDT